MSSNTMLVMELLHASHTAQQKPPPAHRLDSPACRVVSREARKDADDGGMQRLNILAVGIGVCATDLTFVLAEHKKITAEALIDELAAGHAKAGHATELPAALRAMGKGVEATAELFAGIFVRDQGAFMDLIVELGDYAATCVSALAALDISPVDETLAELEITLNELG
ncbi:hypothetical protein [Streptomyces sp. NPDC093097]|uniref:hypothetical protein n=1 Tax=Streptomyces sp. NPDC093097 TaxID=3366027 RepID=UPI003806BDE1